MTGKTRQEIEANIERHKKALDALSVQARAYATKDGEARAALFGLMEEAALDPSKTDQVQDALADFLQVDTWRRVYGDAKKWIGERIADENRELLALDELAENRAIYEQVKDRYLRLLKDKRELTDALNRSNIRDGGKLREQIGGINEQLNLTRLNRVAKAADALEDFNKFVQVFRAREKELELSSI